MTEVVSYRLSDENSKSIEKLARKRGMPLATLSSKIIDNYLNLNLQLEESGYVFLPKQPLRILLKSLDESKFDPIIEAAAKQIMFYLSLRTIKVTDKDVIEGLERWCEGNAMMLELYDENEFTKLICKHDLGINWSKIVIGILSQLFQTELLSPKLEEETFSFKLKNYKELSQLNLVPKL